MPKQIILDAADNLEDLITSLYNGKIEFTVEIKRQMYLYLDTIRIEANKEC